MTAIERIRKLEYLSPPSHYPQIDVEFLLRAFKTVWKIYLDERSNGRFTEEILLKKFEEEMTK